MGFGDHLEELRRRLLYALGPIIPVFLLLFLGWQTVLGFLVGPAFEVLAASGTSASAATPDELEAATPCEHNSRVRFTATASPPREACSPEASEEDRSPGQARVCCYMFAWQSCSSCAILVQAQWT